MARQTKLKPRKRTPPKKLNQKEWRFCHEFVYGPHAGVASRCYQIACYPDRYEAGEPPTPTMTQTGRRWLALPLVSETIDKLRQDLAVAEGLTPDGHMAELRRLRELASKDGDYKAAIKAEELRGKAAGLYVERHQHLHADVGEAQIVSELGSLLRQHPELAAMFQDELKLLPAKPDAEPIDAEVIASDGE